MRALIGGRSAVHRAGIATFLRQVVDDAEVCEAPSLQDAVDEVLHAPDFGLVVLDLEACNGEPLRQLKVVSDAVRPAPVLVICDAVNRQSAVRTLEVGAAGCLNRSASEDQTVAALRRVIDGDVWVPPPDGQPESDAQKMTTKLSDPAAVPGPSDGKLSLQQMEILEQLRDGRTNREIAAVLGVSPYTVRYHVSVILRVLGVTNRTAAAMRAAQILGSGGQG